MRTAAPRNTTDLCHPATVVECQRAYPVTPATTSPGTWASAGAPFERAEAVVEAAEEVPEEYG